MCLILISYETHPDYRAIIAANRDEFYQRPTRAAGFWNTVPDMLAGKDLQGGGTWMGISRRGRFAAVTNYREPNVSIEDPPSRGILVLDFLRRNTHPENYLKEINSVAHGYHGFNIIVGNGEGLFYYSNRGKNIIKVLPGIHGLSNHLINSPWPKVEKGKQELSAILSTDKNIDIEKIFKLLADRSVPPDQLLPDTGVGLEWEKILSPLFITSSIYGTRSSTILLWDRNNNINFFERSFIMTKDAEMRPETLNFCFHITKDI